ncbi:MAG: hypothetical protein EOP04_05890 [Proteobacteria bacterium]|nr:MAG: hypothetical protein EOP04_05890 [Pseudomonadota bacterium]
MSATDFQDVVDSVTSAVKEKRIALFTGSGFTKALHAASPDWGQLLERVWLSLDDEAKLDPKKPFSDFLGNGKSYYRVADEMAEALKSETKTDDGESFLKSRIAKELPKIDNVSMVIQVEWRKILSVLNPSICMTTNYDLILEKLVSHSKTCGGSIPVTHAGETVPVYHMHGSVLNHQEIVIFESDSINTMLPNSYASIKIPSIFYEYVTIMLGYGLSDSNVSYFLGLSRFLGTTVSDRHKLILVNYKANGAHNAVTSKSGMVVVESSDIKETMRDLLRDCLMEEINKKVQELEDGYHGHWFGKVQPDQSVNWDECADFLTHVLNELEAALRADVAIFRFMMPTYAKWLNEALGWCGHSFGMSYEGQRRWSAWLGTAKMRNKELLRTLEKEADQKDLKALKVSLNE